MDIGERGISPATMTIINGPARLCGKVLDSDFIGSSGFFVGVSLGKTFQSPSLVMVKPRTDMNNMSFLRDVSNAVQSGVKHHSINLTGG